MTLAELAEMFQTAPARVELAEHHALEKIGVLVEKTAKEMLGKDQSIWPELAESTIADKERVGAPTPSPLLRTGEHVRDTIEHHVEGHSVYIGSNSPVADYQENGTSRIPPRPFLKTAVVREEHAIGTIIEEHMAVAIGFRP